MSIEAIVLPLDFRAQSPLESEQPADERDIQIRARRQENQVIAGRAVCLHDREPEGPESLLGFEAVDESDCPGVDDRTPLAAHDHADHPGFEFATIAISPIAVECERQAPKAQ